MINRLVVSDTQSGIYNSNKVVIIKEISSIIHKPKHITLWIPYFTREKISSNFIGNMYLLYSPVCNIKVIVLTLNLYVGHLRDHFWYGGLHYNGFKNIFSTCPTIWEHIGVFHDSTIQVPL